MFAIPPESTYRAILPDVRTCAFAVSCGMISKKLEWMRQE